MVMFFMMVGWHIYGKQNLSTETYKTTPEKFTAQAQAMVDKYTVRTEPSEKSPWWPPPEGSDVYMIARLWNFWPILELEKGKTYKLHLTRWTTTTASRCSPPTSTSRSCPAMST
jgi:cytochrome c oxidase subunit 2